MQELYRCKSKQGFQWILFNSIFPIARCCASISITMPPMQKVKVAQGGYATTYRVYTAKNNGTSDLSSESWTPRAGIT